MLVWLYVLFGCCTSRGHWREMILSSSRYSAMFPVPKPPKSTVCHWRHALTIRTCLPTKDGDRALARDQTPFWRLSLSVLAILGFRRATVLWHAHSEHRLVFRNLAQYMADMAQLPWHGRVTSWRRNFDKCGHADWFRTHGTCVGTALPDWKSPSAPQQGGETFHFGSHLASCGRVVTTQHDARRAVMN